MSPKPPERGKSLFRQRFPMFATLLLPLVVLLTQFCLVRSIAAAPERLTTVVIRDVPHVKQKPDFCGEACAEMWLRRRKAALDQDDVFDQSGLDPTLGRGCYTKELIQALQRIGFRVGDVFTAIPVKTADTSLHNELPAKIFVSLSLPEA